MLCSNINGVLATPLLPCPADIHMVHAECASRQYWVKIAPVLTKEVSMTTTEFVCLLWRLVPWVYNTMNAIVWLEGYIGI